MSLRTRSEEPPVQPRDGEETLVLPGDGPSAYLDADAILEVAARARVSMLYPGYGFLSESPELARRCARAGITFVGPTWETLELLGDKVRARALATSLGLPVLQAVSTLDEARALVAATGGVMVKAVGGGGGRGMRAVTDIGTVDDAWARASREAERAFGDDRVYAEEYLSQARHIEVQVLGDGDRAVAVGDRDCSVQRRHQKVVEIAPAVTVSAAVRAELADAAVRVCESAGLRGAATVETLVTEDRWVFLEVNPRIQVEHPVTECVTGVDLVATQLRLALGASLTDLELDERPPQRGIAIESRLTAEQLGTDGTPSASVGCIEHLDLPSGPGARVDTWARTGTRIDGQFDPLLAKVITASRGNDLALALREHLDALGSCHIDGVTTNLDVLRRVISHPIVEAGEATTSFFDDHLVELLGAQADAHEVAAAPMAGENGDHRDVVSPSIGTVLEIRVGVGDTVRRGEELVLLEAMKMEHSLSAPCDGTVVAVEVAVGETVSAGRCLIRLAPSGVQQEQDDAGLGIDLDAQRPDLDLVQERHRPTLDEARPEAVARRHAKGMRTARENITDLVDDGSFLEYGALAIAAQRRRRSLDDLVTNTPADGIVTGLARINGDLVDDPTCAVLAYDYTVMAGTQGVLNHKKTDRLLELAHERRLPVVLFAEGGGGRPGDTDSTAVSMLDVSTFSTMGALRGVVPTVGIAAGRCFAGNAALLGACDVVIATRSASIGMGGPAMIEGGGLGFFAPEEVGPAREQYAAGVIDVLVEDEAAAVATTKRVLAILQQARVAPGTAEDQRVLRHVVPTNRKRAYDMRRGIVALLDDGEFIELRGGFAQAAITGVGRIGGRAVGIMANDPGHGGGAIDAEAGVKLDEFMAWCDRHHLPLISLCDTPGFMVGPDSERQGTVRIFPRMFVTGSQLSVPIVTVITRKGYGLGAMAMAGGSFDAPVATVSWPTGEIGAMGLEGAVRLGYRKELEAVPDGDERRRLYDELVSAAYEAGRATNAAQAVELDAVIDPAETRDWIITAFEGA